MPTGYTAKVQKGDETFGQFVWGCARAFGALVTMRDAPVDAPVPEAFEVSDFYYGSVSRAETRLAELRDMTDEEAETAALEEANEAREYNDQAQAQRAQERANYESMLAKVKAWEPPTKDHAGLRQFMIEQLVRSIEFDCGGDPYLKEEQPLSGAEWRAARLADTERDLDYARKSLREEEARVRSRNEWISALRESVPYEQPE